MARTAFTKDKKSLKTRKSSLDSKHNSLQEKKPSLAKGARKRSIAVKTPRIISPLKIKKTMRKSTVIREIAFFQKNTDMLISKLPFSRYIRDIVRQKSIAKDFRFERMSIIALQEAFEAYIVSLLEDSNLCANHAKRITLFEKDVNLVKKLSKNTYDND